MSHQGLTKATGIIDYLKNYFSFFSFVLYPSTPFLPPPCVPYLLLVFQNLKMPTVSSRYAAEHWGNYLPKQFPKYLLPAVS